ncbi:LysR family transcriptional regulator [Rouxiella chamberiensis]|uniref:LysR family transcriptional regulator n=1 Tax=Rouxiella chamberiensis TaxID=1513468 RepID=A0ABY7HNN0_9GAMM|nr:LysR family transcriptional regulator [Rouxiella chamberiensis]WAT00978.1 LysR family transcriptional regulator [Rouxiella chamberiensis]
MIKLKPLSYFKAVCEHGSISAASDVLFIAQPPLSKALHQLEDEWGVKLFDRSSRGMTPTEAGTYLYRRASDLLQMASEIDEEMQAFGEGDRGVVRIGTVSMGIPRVAAAMKRLKSEHPHLGFSLQQGDTGYLEELLDRRRIDVALVHLPLTTRDEDLAIQPLARACFRVMCLADSPLAHHRQVTLTQLVEWPLVVMRRKSGFGVYDNVMQFFLKAGLKPQILADASDVPMMKYLVEQGMGVGLLPMLEENHEVSTLLTLPVPELDAVADDLVLIYRSPHPCHTVLRTVIDAFVA